MESASVYTSEFCTGDFLPLGGFSLFSRHTSVANYVDSAGNLIFLTRNFHFLAPHAIFPGNRQFSFPEYISVETDSIHCSAFQFERKKCREFDSTFSVAPYKAPGFESRLFSVVRENLLLFPKKSLIFTAFENFEPETLCGLDIALVKKVRAATSLIAQRHILQGVESLKGLGQGTTPAGDDFIAGMLYGLHYLQQVDNTANSKLISDILAISRGSNLISNAMLVHAASGRYFLSLKKIFLSVSQDDDSTSRLGSLFMHGATSGADILSGFCFTVKNRIKG